jgi:hypothetical protein
MPATLLAGTAQRERFPAAQCTFLGIDQYRQKVAVGFDDFCRPQRFFLPTLKHR